MVNAQVCDQPAAMALTPLESPLTFTGMRLPKAELFPNSALPQHITPPVVVNAQVWYAPAAMGPISLGRVSGAAFPIVLNANGITFPVPLALAAIGFIRSCSRKAHKQAIDFLVNIRPSQVKYETNCIQHIVFKSLYNLFG